ncbi:hypothetical protein IMPR6_10118 [Imperialibacter sp. EC-SDR9]|nr:hypothetical protein IMPERIA75_10116 [Imperialibacter sp. 75]CAD5247072.1 hypothetical protein IMPERIA89_10117 [Imperialibacter sp. 89]VVS96614.1 hypothetical protein IMPR6_10118 [Imperialibacter sp. EC-SDR9]
MLLYCLSFANWYNVISESYSTDFPLDPFYGLRNTFYLTRQFSSGKLFIFDRCSMS